MDDANVRAVEGNENSPDTISEIIKGEDFEKALTSAADVRRETLTTLKNRNKNNYDTFYELMFSSRRDVQEISDKKKKDRTDSENEIVKAFKKETSGIYKQISNLIAEEELEDGEMTKIQKLVAKIAPLVKMMQYIGNTEIDDEFEKYGITLEYEKLDENEGNVFDSEDVRETVKKVFSVGKEVVEGIEKNNEIIKTTIYESEVPPDLRFDKNSNPVGLKNSDFLKLVNIKTELLMAENEEDREKVDKKASDLAGEYEFDNARNKLIQTKLVNF